MRRQLVTASLGLVLALGAAACGGDDDGGGGSGGQVTVLGTDALAFEPSELTVAAGTVSIELTAGETVEHTFNVEELGDRQIVSVDAGQTQTGTVELEAGTYTFFCDVPGHREAGMEGTLDVTG